MMTYEELREEAKKQGYRLVANNKKEKLLPCTCGSKRRKHGESWDGKRWSYSLTCYKCGNKVIGESEDDAIRKWNEMITNISK